MPTYQCTLNLADGATGQQRQVHFHFDPAHLSQRIMLEALSANKLYEPETINLVHMILQPGDSFMDIGAHVGFFSMLAAARVGATGRVYSFEPNRDNYLHLLSHIQLNKFENIFPFHWAVGSQSKVVDFYVNVDNDGGHALWDPGLHPFNEQSRHNVKTAPAFQFKLDDLFGNSPPNSIKLIKIDTEGNEPHVLIGAQRLIRSARVPAIIAEVNPFGLQQLRSSEREMRELMTYLGYTTYILLQATPTRLAENQYYPSQAVFNLLFVHADLQQMVAKQWPQTTTF